jgi:G6PDH family F420-dependent oxidoreductase
MVGCGYTLLGEQAGPRELVDFARSGERAGFDFEVMSDHYFPWLERQGHSPYAWSTLGAVSQVTERVELMTYVTCPILRYHPAVVAQKAATVQALSNGRFTLGLGAGENLNEHVVGRGWPAANVRHEMFGEALNIIGELFDGGYVNYAGKHFRVDSAKIWDLPERRVPIATAVSGQQSVALCAPRADAMIAVEPLAELVREWDLHSLDKDKRKIGQLPVSFGSHRAEAIRRAHAEFRWFGGGWKVNAELPGPASFTAATRLVTESDVAGGIPCGPDAEPIVAAVRSFVDAGFTDVAIAQIGGDRQRDFLDFAEKELLPALREAG